MQKWVPNALCVLLPICLICTASEQLEVASVDIAAAMEIPVALGIFTFYKYADRVNSYPQYVNYKHLLSIVPP